MNTSHKKHIEHAFDKGAATYDQATPIQKQVADKLCHFLPKETIQTILEVGCGSGTLTQKLKKHYPNAAITALDLSQKMIDISQQEINDVTFIKADGESYEPNQTFDLIISTIQWFDAPIYALDRWIGSLNPQGRILYSVPGPHHFEEWAKHCRRHKLPNGLHPCPSYPGLMAEKYFLQNYESGFEFLRTLKESGAHKPRKGYIALNAAQLRKLCTSFSGALRWHILFGQLQRPS